MHLCGQFLDMCDAAATSVGRMCPGACAQDTFLMQCYNKWEDKTEDKALKDISDTRNVQCIVCFFPPTQVLSVFMHLCGQFLHMCFAAATYVGRMCPGACAQDTFLMQCCKRWEDKTVDEAFKNIFDTQTVQCIVCFFHPPKCSQCFAPMWSVSWHVRCCSYICGQDVSRRMRPRYFPDAVLQ